jgi:hypothetical protein
VVAVDVTAAGRVAVAGVGVRGAVTGAGRFSCPGEAAKVRTATPALSARTGHLRDTGIPVILPKKEPAPRF